VQHLLSQKSSIYNLTGSSAALLLAVEDVPFAAVEKDEARAEILKRDIDFYRAIFSGGKIFFLPDRNGAASSGRRAEVLYQLTSEDSVVTSESNLIATLVGQETPRGKLPDHKKGRLSRPLNARGAAAAARLPAG